MKALLSAALVLVIAVVACGCRVNSTTTANHITLGTVSGDVRMDRFEFGRGNNDATQAADKEVGDIAPKAAVAAGPLSKVTEAGNNADAGATTAPVPGL